MTQVLFVGIGGFIGSVLRYLTTGWVLRSYPNLLHGLGTVMVNLLGCFLIGLAAGLFSVRGHLPQEYRLLAITGVLGGFTTFSAFGLEADYLLRQGDFIQLGQYVGLNLIGGIFLVGLGLFISHQLLR